ncbi:MAG: hypothetical protein K0R49_1706 [Burkholderiales bacterium]|jgi:H+/Cl- antiporter ClcA|nr:hypothetical protein [Burkholderiales bacterium]MCE3269452.1 hypothetical protein [Burkholderiales bacterium]
MEFKNFLNKNSFKELCYFLVMACAIGIFSVILAKSCEGAFFAFLYIFHHLHYWVLLIIPTGFVTISYLIKNYFPEAEGSGIPQTMAMSNSPNSNNLRRFFIPRVIFTKFIFIVLGTGFGATIGREGPTVQIGAIIMLLGKKGLTTIAKKTLITIGAAAGLAAAFNTPIGGMVFAFEELSKSASQEMILKKVSGIAVAGITVMLIIGNYSYFGRVERHLLNYDWKIFVIALVIGIFAAVNCYLLNKIIYYLTLSPTSKINKWRKSHLYLTAAICGLICAIIGVLSSGLSFGNGYIESNDLLNNNMILPKFYYLYKMSAAIFSSASGVPGGYFATSLAIGNGIGNFIHNIYAVANIQQYCLLGMAAFLAALTRAPVTAIVMILQITSSQVFTLPIIVAALTATWVAHVFGKGIYEYQIENYLK